VQVYFIGRYQGGVGIVQSIHNAILCSKNHAMAIKALIVSDIMTGWSARQCYYVKLSDRPLNRARLGNRTVIV
jgi:hypothetical protein